MSVHAVRGNMGNCELEEILKGPALGAKRTEFPVARGSVTEGVSDTSERENR